jgi:hypothetical protein
MTDDSSQTPQRRVLLRLRRASTLRKTAREVETPGVAAVLDQMTRPGENLSSIPIQLVMEDISTALV